MRKKSAKSVLTSLFRVAGVIVDGHHPWDIQVNNEDFYQRVLRDGELGLGESYMDGWWDCERVDMFIQRLFEAMEENYIQNRGRFFWKILFAKIINYQTKRYAFEIGKKHYDLSHSLFEATLDKTLNYTSGYWKEAHSLEEAQNHKMDLVCKKLLLQPGMRILDINCSWGAFAKYAAEHYGVSVVGITISRHQALYAKKICAHLPVEIHYRDFRDVNEIYDRIVSIGMFEHVGHLNYRDYMTRIRSCLTHEGMFLLHTIGANQSSPMANNWITKYIFPGGMLPSISQIGTATEELLVMEDWHNFGIDYDKTLMEWHRNFNHNWTKISANYDEHFYRMWNYYLLSCAGGFRARALQVWQIVFSHSGLSGGYQGLR